MNRIKVTDPVKEKFDAARSKLRMSNDEYILFLLALEEKINKE